MVTKVAKALKPGGKILIHEFILDNTMDGPLFPALFALNMLIGTDRGQSYSETQQREMLEKCNIWNFHRLDVNSPQ